MYNMLKAVMDDDRALKCPTSTNVSDVGVLDDLVIHNQAFDIAVHIVEDVSISRNSNIGMIVQKHRSPSNDDMSFINNDEDPIMETDCDEDILQQMYITRY